MASSSPEYARTYYLANRERLLAANRARRLARKQIPGYAEKLREYSREYHRIRRQTGWRPKRFSDVWTPEKQLDSTLRFHYGIGIEEYNDLLKQQHGACAICDAKPPFGYRKRLCVDHDHRTGRIRGLLCPLCNSMLGHLNDDLTRAVAYLAGAPNATKD